MTKLSSIFLSALVLSSLLYCGGPGNKRESLTDKVRNKRITLKDVFEEGQRLMFRRRYQDARQRFRVIETLGADTPFFALTKLSIADSYFFDRMATYVEASVEYKSFLTHFPTHVKADYAQYQYAMCFFTEIENAERDQTSTNTAYVEFKNLIDRFPASPYAFKAKEKIELCLLRLAEHEFKVAYYYYRRGQGFEVSAESRLKYIINNYPGHFDEEKVFYYLAETLWRRGKYAEAMRYFSYIEENFEQSEYRPFVDDKMARYERILQSGEDPGALTTEDIPADALKAN